MESVSVSSHSTFCSIGLGTLDITLQRHQGKSWNELRYVYIFTTRRLDDVPSKINGNFHPLQKYSRNDTNVVQNYNDELNSGI